jgi:hypothetical protein
MQRASWSWICAAVLALPACDTAEDELAPGSASCDAWVDSELEQCPEYVGTPSKAIERCEEDRLDDELIGCEEPYARFVICMTDARGYDCEEGPNDCYEEIDAMIRCRQRFAQRTSCSRVARDDVCVGQPQPYSFNCIGDGPAGCGPDIHEQTEAQQVLNIGFRCCPSFASEGASYFSDAQ